jgi:hypothetical protein
MAQLLLNRALTHLVAFGVGALALRLVRDHGRAPSEADDHEEDEVEDEDEDDGEEEDDDDESVARQKRLAGYAVRDGYVAEAAADETFKMLLLCNMELYRTSSKTGEVRRRTLTLALALTLTLALALTLTLALALTVSEVKAVKMSAGKAAAQCSHAVRLRVGCG